MNRLYHPDGNSVDKSVDLVNITSLQRAARADPKSDFACWPWRLRHCSPLIGERGNLLVLVVSTAIRRGSFGGITTDTWTGGTLEYPPNNPQGAAPREIRFPPARQSPAYSRDF